MPQDPQGDPPGDAPPEGTPTLTELLQTLQSQARDGAAPVDLVDALRAEILRAVRNELGASAGEVATLLLQGSPLTERTVERVLQAATRASAARTAALNSAGLVPSGTEGRLTVRTAVVEATPPRDLRLLRYCLELIRANRPELQDARAFWRAGERLHDRVRALLEQRGHWPIGDERAYEEHAKPAALVLLSWKDPQG